PPGETRAPVAFGLAVMPVLNDVLMAERWVHWTWYASPPKFSAGNFQLQGMTHRCIPPMTSMPPSRRSKNASRYQVISPRYSSNGGASGSNVAKINPL